MEGLCGSPEVRSPGTVYPLHTVGSVESPRASLAIGASWLFMSLPTSMSSAAIKRCQSSRVGDDAKPQPFVMAHLAGIRTGAWSRRALVRAYGWWHARADHLVALNLGWGNREGALILQDFPSGTGTLPALMNVVRSQASFDLLAGNLLLLAMLLGRRAVIPEVACSMIGSAAVPRRGFGNRPVGARRVGNAGTTCAWVPPRECWHAEYVTALEFEREMERKSSPAANHVGANRVATDTSGGLQQLAEGLKSRVAAGDFDPKLLRDLASTTEQLRLPTTGRIGTTSAPRGWPSVKGIRGRPGVRSTLAACDAHGRELALLLAPAAPRLSASVGTVRNASVQLRRRLRELACDRSRVVLPIIPDQVIARTVELNQSDLEAAGLHSTLTDVELPVLQAILAPLRQDRQHLQLARLLASVPLTRQGLSFDSVISFTRSRGNHTLVDQGRQAGELKCIRSLLTPLA